MIPPEPPVTLWLVYCPQLPPSNSLVNLYTTPLYMLSSSSLFDHSIILVKFNSLPNQYGPHVAELGKTKTKTPC